VRGLCEQPDERLLPGGFAAVILALTGVRDGFLIPTEALVPSASGQGVYVVRGSTAELVTVEIGARTPDRVQILRGIQPGDRIIVTNLIRLRPGATVTVEPTLAAGTR
jgi:membrane fusion protein (multidrug efflux system)